MSPRAVSVKVLPDLRNCSSISPLNLSSADNPVQLTNCEVVDPSETVTPGVTAVQLTPVPDAVTSTLVMFTFSPAPFLRTSVTPVALTCDSEHPTSPLITHVSGRELPGLKTP